MLGLLSEVPKKNCWTIAEYAGDATPDGMQHLLAAARWDAGAVRDDLREFVMERLGDPGAVLVAGETGDLKKGTTTAGVQRQYTGTAGKIENCQVAVFLTYASPAGHALIDRELYLPAAWVADPGRCRAAGIPEGIVFAAKPQLARVMIARALDAGTPAAWVAADEVYGADPGLRTDLEARQIGYMLAVAKTCQVTTGAGACQAGTIAARLSGAALLRRRRRQRPPPLRLGLGGHGSPPPWLPLAADPPPPPYPGTGVLPLLLTRQHPPRHLGQSRRAALDHRGELPGCHGPDRARSASGPPLGLLVPVDHPGHARARLPHHHRRRRAHPQSSTRRADPAHPQRDRRPVHQAGHPASTGHLAPPAMVHLAATPPAPRQAMPLPAASVRTMKITISGWSTNALGRRQAAWAGTTIGDWFLFRAMPSHYVVGHLLNGLFASYLFGYLAASAPMSVPSCFRTCLGM